MAEPDNLVIFKSFPDNWLKEKGGNKNNTMRKVDAEDRRFKLLRERNLEAGCPMYIGILNTETNECFIRAISDYTEFEGWAVISWD